MMGVIKLPKAFNHKKELGRLIEKLEDIDDVRLFDEAKSSKQSSMSFDDYVKQRKSK